MSEQRVADDVCLATYRSALRHGAYIDDLIAKELSLTNAEVRWARGRLLQLRLLATHGSNDLAIPVNPEIAESELCAPLEEDVRVRRSALAQIHHEMSSYVPLYREYAATRRRDELITVVDDAREVERELIAAARSCRVEVLTMQPGGGRPAGTLRGALPRDLGMLDRGVRMRILYQHLARASLATQRYVREVSARGAETRTIAEIVDRLIVFDNKIAFLQQKRVHKRVPGATILTEPTVVDYLRRTFESSWEVGRAFVPEGTVYREVTDEIRSSILHLMALGLKDEAIARRLGMAPRTCRRFISSMMEELHAASRFQAGVKASQLGLLSTTSRGPEKAPDEASPG